MNRITRISCRVLSVTTFFVFAFCFPVQGESLVVKKAYSGNSIKLIGDDGKVKKIRYIGVDVPDRGKPFYEFCRDANKAMVDQKQVVLKTDVIKTSADEKLLCYVYVGALFINAEMIRNGYGLAHTLSPNNRYQDMFLSLQQEARKNRKGLWAFEDHNDEPYYVGSKSKNVFHRPSCSHVKGLVFDDRIILRTKEEALNSGFTQDWRCSPLFMPPAAKGQKRE